MIGRGYVLSSEDQVQDTDLVDPQAGMSMSERAAVTAARVTAKMSR